MANVYTNVDCSFCEEKGVQWDRFECLICDEYYLCRECFKDKQYSNEHRPFHPMQLVLNREQFLRFVNSTVPPKDKIRLYCPICGTFKTSVVEFQEHSQQKHADNDDRVKCPVCVSFSIPDARSTQWTLNSHLQKWHGEREEGLICNTCDVDAIKGNRYSCLICDMYDQCEICFKTKQHDDDHLPYHPMQKVLPKAVYKKVSWFKIYRCPFCGEDEFSARGLADHCHELHSHSQSVRVRCPICTVRRVCDSIRNDSLINHLTNYHGLFPNGPKPKTVDFDEMYCQCTHYSFHDRLMKVLQANNSTCPICHLTISVFDYKNARPFN